MIITFRPTAPKEVMGQLLGEMEQLQLAVTPLGGSGFIFAVTGNTLALDSQRITANPYVESVQRITDPYRLASRLFFPGDTVVSVGGVPVGGEKVVVIAGPCSVESEDGVLTIARQVKNAGATLLRGGAYKPRTSPYAFQGLGREGLVFLKQAGEKTGMPVVSEILSESQIAQFEEYADLIQVGARNMQNYSLLKALGKSKKPVLLKRGFANTIEEWLMSAEYILDGGNNQVILCERGIRTFERAVRNTLDLSAIGVVKEKSHLPVVVDPSHAAGNWRLVERLSLAAVAAGADGLMVEVHDRPQEARSDGGQSLKPDNFAALMKKANAIAGVLGRTVL